MLSSNNTTLSHTTMHNAEEQYYYGRQVVSASNASVGNSLIVDWPQFVDSAADEAATRRYPRKKHRRVTNKTTKTKRSVRFSDMSSMQVYTPDTPHSYYYTAKDRKRFSKDALLDAVCIKTHLLMLSRSSPLPREDEEMFMTMMDIFEPGDIIGIEQFVFCKDWKKYSSAKIRQDHARAVLCAQQALIRVDEGEETISSEDRAKKLCDFASYHSSRSIEEARSRARL